MTRALNSRGVDTKEFQRAIVASDTSRKWSQLVSGKLTVPYYIHENTFSQNQLDQLRKVLQKIQDSGDLGCVQLKELSKLKVAVENFGHQTVEN